MQYMRVETIKHPADGAATDPEQGVRTLDNIPAILS